MRGTVTTDEWSERNTRQRTSRRPSPYPSLDRYGRKPEIFFCRNCVIYIDNPVVAEKHSVATGHIVDETFP
ncbi:hypothetical protein [Candidatus Nitrososphaera gargensis]|uniref:hypothetical protein n=1 Tax=Candidatus Nitrososphaera gargensis TaxID=497727 RepID=UPI0011E553D8|nr:hypothetical protein [Candidatus Nitrososphaera gargensis]